MVVGNGLVANALRDFENDDSILVFASGVSNSVNPQQDDFEREKELLLSFSKSNKRLVYFSTCSIFDFSLKQSAYVIHKINMEQIVKATFKKFLILRLPTLIGNTGNPITFFNYFKIQIEQKQTLNVNEKAIRYLFDAAHLNPILKVLRNYPNNCINCAFQNGASVLKIISTMAEIMNKPQPNIILKKGNSFDFDNSFFISILKKNNLTFDVTIENILTKYL